MMNEAIPFDGVNGSHGLIPKALSPNNDSMLTIREVLNQFLAEVGEGNRGSKSSPFSVIDLFGVYLNDYGHEDLNEFERSRFDKEWTENHRFCDIFGPDHIQPNHINSFLSGFIICKVAVTKGFLKACGPAMEKFA